MRYVSLKQFNFFQLTDLNFAVFILLLQVLLIIDLQNFVFMKIEAFLTERKFFLYQKSEIVL